MPPAFDKAARRHLRDGDLLHAANRFDNADHLAGLAAECALKAILQLAPGVLIHPEGYLVNGAGKAYKLHIDKLWADLVTTTPHHAFAMLSATNPFATWRVHHRYDAPSATQDSSLAHLLAALNLLELWAATTGNPL